MNSSIYSKMPPLLLNMPKTLQRSVFLIVIALFLPKITIAAELVPFTTDGCSAFPDGTLEQRELFLVCCTDHDFAYWKGGTVEQRLYADNEFSACIANVGQPALAKVMLLGVRAGGVPYLPTPFRWGYGWPFPRGYGKLTVEEERQVKKLTPQKYR